MAYYNGKKVIGNGRLDLGSPYYEFVNEEFNKSANLFDKNAIVRNQELTGSNGTASSSSGWYVSDYINVKDLSNVCISGTRTTGSSFCFYDSNKNFISTVDIFATNGSFTGAVNVPTNATYVRFNGKLAETDLMLNAGTTALPYQPYNSSSHITNTQADLLKNEYDKSKNKFDISKVKFALTQNPTIDLENGTITVYRYDSTSSTLLKDCTDLEVGKTYILSLTEQVGEKYIYLVGTQTTWRVGQTHTITQADLDNTLAFYGQTGTTNVISQIMISEDGGEYQPYNGEIIHRGDIEPVLLWENGNPNSDMVVTFLTLSKQIEIGKKYGIVWSFGKGWNKLITEFIYNGGSDGIELFFGRNIASDNHLNISTRQLVFSGNVVNVSNCFYYDGTFSGTILNSLNIPLQIYELPN